VSITASDITWILHLLLAADLLRRLSDEAEINQIGYRQLLLHPWLFFYVLDKFLHDRVTDSAVVAQRSNHDLVRLGSYLRLEPKAARNEVGGIFAVLTKGPHGTKKAAQYFFTCCGFFSNFSLLAEKPVSGSFI
jgi:hypothetical protein